MAVLGGKFTFPSDGRGGYSEEFKELIKGCLKVKSEERWGIDEVSSLSLRWDCQKEISRRVLGNYIFLELDE